MHICSMIVRDCHVILSELSGRCAHTVLLSDMLVIDQYCNSRARSVSWSHHKRGAWADNWWTNRCGHDRAWWFRSSCCHAPLAGRNNMGGKFFSSLPSFELMTHSALRTQSFYEYDILVGSPSMFHWISVYGKFNLESLRGAEPVECAKMLFHRASIHC